MACETRRKTGNCGHTQCPYPEASGYEYVEIAFGPEGRGYCEVGLYCVEECAYTYYVYDEEDAGAAWAEKIGANG